MISVVVPVYNVEKYVAECVDSIVNQTYKDLEIILVDDGSTDNSGAICDELAGKDERIKVIHKTNGGLSDARNAGIDIAKGEYISFIDSDDYIHPQMLELLLHTSLKIDSDISVCLFASVGETEKRSFQTIDDNTISVSTYSENRLSEIYNNNLITVVAWNKLYKKSLFNSIRYAYGKIHEDEFIIHELLFAASKVAYIDTELYFYRTRSNSIMQNVSLKSIEHGYEALIQREQFFASKELPQNVSETRALEALYITKYYRYVLKKYHKALLLKQFVNDMHELTTDDVKEIVGIEAINEYSLFANNTRLYYFYINQKSKHSLVFRIMRRIMVNGK